MRVDVVIPVYNEESILKSSVTTLRELLPQSGQYQLRIVIANNGSTDRTIEIAEELACLFRDVTYIDLVQKGRGRALKAAWINSDADVVSYMDVDLSTDLSAFVPMVEALVERGYHVASGSRLKKESQVVRSAKREIVSRGYNLLIKLFFPRRLFSDAHIGFKALTRQAVSEIIPLVEDNNWFFDAELLIRAEQRGYEIAEVPVRWVENSDSRVKIAKSVWENVRGLLRVRFTRSNPHLTKRIER